MTALGVLCVVCMTLLAFFFLPSASLMNMYIINTFDTEKNVRVIPDDPFKAFSNVDIKHRTTYTVHVLYIHIHVLYIHIHVLYIHVHVCSSSCTCTCNSPACCTNVIPLHVYMYCMLH